MDNIVNSSNSDTIKTSSSLPQVNRSNAVRASLDALNTVEYAKMNRILKEEYDKKQASILDKPLGEILNNTVNFLGNSYNSYSDKYVEAKFSRPLYETEDPNLHQFQLHLIAMALFIRDDENIIYLGIIMIIIAFLICFINITRGNESRILETTTKQ